MANTTTTGAEVEIKDVETVDQAYFKSPAWIERKIDRMAITLLVLSGMVKTIGDGGFYICEGLTSLTLGAFVESIGGGAFGGCIRLASLVIPDSVKTIGNAAFRCCKGLTSLTLGASVESIGGGAFEGCTGLASLVIPDSVKTIGCYAFHLCKGLTSLTLGASVVSIGERAFEGCTGLASLVIPDSVKTIGKGAFCGTSLTSVVVPAGCEVHEQAFPPGCKVTKAASAATSAAASTAASTATSAAAQKAAAQKAAAEQPEPEDPVLEELKTAEGIVYASLTETYVFMMSDGVPIVRFRNTTGEVEEMEGEEWVPCTLDAPGATTSGGVVGTPGGSGPYPPLEIKKRRVIFLKQCKTHGGFNLGERTNLMASGCGRTCLPDAMLTIESHLKGTPVRGADMAKTRRWFRERHPGDPNERDAEAYGAEKGLDVTYRQDTSPKNLLKLTDACLTRLEYKYEEKGVLKLETHYMAFLNGMLIDNDKHRDPPVITHADKKNNKTAMAPFWHYFNENTKEIKLTHVYVVTLRAPKRSADDCAGENSSPNPSPVGKKQKA